MVKGEVPQKIRKDEIFLRSQVYVSVGKFTEAITLLKSIKGDRAYSGYIEYNLAMAYLQNSQVELAIDMLDELGRLSSDDEAVLALKDKGNLKLANYYVDKGDAEKAAQYFSRIRLDARNPCRRAAAGSPADASRIASCAWASATS